MSRDPDKLSSRPEAGRLTVQALVERVDAGLIRIPPFQRALRWDAGDVEKLFDSLFRGYPVGSLLFWKHPAKAGPVKLGPLMIQAGEVPDAWWVVDGQQRITSLASALLRDVGTSAPSMDPFSVFFDPQTEKFHAGPKTQPSKTWVPLAVFLDAVELGDWLHDWTGSERTQQRRVVFDASRRIREYELPYYVVSEDDQEVLREIFYRSNTYGKGLDWTEVHNALFSSSGDEPSTLAGLADELVERGMGRLDEDELLQMWISSAGLDPSENLQRHLQGHRESLPKSLAESSASIRMSLDFLRREARVPHRRLLPHRFPLVVLARFFQLHPDPLPRTRELLRRWVWRGLRTGAHQDVRSLLRRSVAALNHIEEASVQYLLPLTEKTWSGDYALPPRFDARSAANRVVMLCAAQLRPRRLDDGSEFDVGTLLESQQDRGFQPVLPGPGLSAANRLLHPPDCKVREAIVKRATLCSSEDPVLASHAITKQAATLLAEGKKEEFLAERARSLVAQIESACRRFGQPNASDRPSLDYLLAETSP